LLERSPVKSHRFGPRALAAALSILAVAVAAPALAQPITHAQPLLKMEPLDIQTSKGVAHFKVEIADTSRTQEVGLMYRQALPADRGMLFEFNRPQSVSFWMEHCPVPLDMLFIEADGTILSIARNTQPESTTAIPSGGTITGVLELRGGRAAEIGANPGDQVKQRFFHHG
jgi:uncharacterized membrane protein (UPF0127 family)